MYFKIRTRLPDTPGALATLASGLGDAGVNILALQIYPDLGSVTDDLVVQVPDACSPNHLIDLVETAGCTEVSVSVCSARELQDQPTRNQPASSGRTGRVNPGSRSRKARAAAKGTCHGCRPQPPSARGTAFHAVVKVQRIWAITNVAPVSPSRRFSQTRVDPTPVSRPARPLIPFVTRRKLPVARS